MSFRSSPDPIFTGRLPPKEDDKGEGDEGWKSDPYRKPVTFRQTVCIEDRCLDFRSRSSDVKNEVL